jgi:FixJ family two-component response regulator
MIAIIDDDVAAREATDDLLKSVGYSTITFASAEEFLSSQGRYQTSCVISDVKMPGMSGLALQQQLVLEHHNVPIILVTAFAEDGMRERALAAGALAFLTKPFSQESLIKCLGSALEVRSQNS